MRGEHHRSQNEHCGATGPTVIRYPFLHLVRLIARYFRVLCRIGKSALRHLAGGGDAVVPLLRGMERSGGDSKGTTMSERFLKYAGTRGWVAAICMALSISAQAQLTQQEVMDRSEGDALRYLSPRVSVSGEPGAAQIVAEVDGLAEVSLITWTGGDSSTCDYADWIEARFEGDNGTVYVSDLPWAFAWTFGGDQWRSVDFFRTRARKDRSVLDTELICGGQAFKKGFGVHAASLVVVKVPGGAKRLVAQGMMDDVTATHPRGGNASAQFMVLAGLPSKGVTELLDLPQVLPAQTRAQIASLRGRCDPALIRDFEGMWKSLLLETRVQKGCFPVEERGRQAYHRSATFLASDRDPADTVARRTHAVWEDLSRTVDLVESGKELGALRQEVRETPVTDADARAALYIKLCRVRRSIAFSNPLLKGLDRLLFITREALPPEELNCGTHMADQYFGFHATLIHAGCPTGGLRSSQSDDAGSVVAIRARSQATRCSRCLRMGRISCASVHTKRTNGSRAWTTTACLSIPAGTMWTGDSTRLITCG